LRTNVRSLAAHDPPCRFYRLCVVVQTVKAAPLKGSSLDLPGITPEHLGDADQR
jgi:hypothetical protein